MDQKTIKENLNAIEWGRFAAERFLLLPAAQRLPAAFALGLANGIGAIDAAIPVKTSAVLRRDLAAATGLRGGALRAQLRERLAMSRRDIVWRHRFRLGREEIDDWELIEVNGGPVHELIAANVSFIAAGGHFTSAAGDLRHKVLPVSGRAVGGATPEWSWNPFEARRRLDAQADAGAREGLMRLGTHGKSAPELKSELPDFWNRQTDWAHPPEVHTVQDQILDELARAGSVSQILIDAYWEKPNAYRRPFAGLADRGFAVGAARIARIAQCPVVPFVAVLGPRPRSVIYEWGDPISPGAPDDKANDRKVIDAALDFLEQGVARHPTQYLHPLGHARRWDERQGAWVSAPPLKT